MARYKYGYDRASNRLWRENTVATAQSKTFDELFEYDGLYRLNEMGRGTLNGTQTALTTLSFAQCFTLDETGKLARLPHGRLRHLGHSAGTHPSARSTAEPSAWGVDDDMQKSIRRLVA